MRIKLLKSTFKERKSKYFSNKENEVKKMGVFTYLGCRRVERGLQNGSFLRAKLGRRCVDGGRERVTRERLTVRRADIEKVCYEGRGEKERWGGIGFRISLHKVALHRRKF